MTFQSAANILAALNRETTLGTIANAAGATRIRVNDSPGLELMRGIIQSKEKRSDGTISMGRLGSKSAPGTFNCELGVGGETDIILEAVGRSLWATATSISFASVTSVTVGTNTVTATGGDWVGGQGIRVGDIFTLSNYSTAADNGLNTQVVAVTSLTITVATGTFTAGSSDATGTLTVLKKLKIGAAAPINYSHSIEQYDADTDLSEVFLGCVANGAKMSYKPNAMAEAVYSFLGINRTALATSTSPYFTSPTLTTGAKLVADDSVIRYNGLPVATFKGFDLDFQLTASAEAVIGSVIPATVITNDLMLQGTVSSLRQDFSNLTLFDAETEFELMMKLEEPTGSPKACLGFYFPRVKIQKLSAPFGGGDGAKVETLQLMFAAKVAATGYDGALCNIFSSAP